MKWRQMKRSLLWILLAGAIGASAQTFPLTIFPDVSMTTVATSAPQPVGASYASGTLQLVGNGLTTATIAVYGCNLRSCTSANYFALPMQTCGDTSGTFATTQTATANACYRFSLAGITNYEYVTSGTFTATSITLTLTASPNAQIGRAGGGSGGSGVSSFNSRTGAVSPANGDYTFDQIGSGTNLGHGLVCGAGCVISGTGGGFINANELNGTLLSGLATGLLTNTTSTGVPTITTMGTGVATFLGTPTSANLASALTDETGTGPAVFAASPALTGTPTVPTAAAGTNTTQAASTAFVLASSVPIISNANFVFDGDSRTAGVNATAVCGASPCTIGTTGYAATTTGTASSGSTALTVASGTGTANGMQVVGQGIAPSTTIASGGGTTSIVLSLATTAALSTTAVKFGNTDYPSQAMTLPPFSGHGTGYNLGIGGQTCSQIALRYSTDAHPLSPAVTGNVGYLFVECGTNAEGTFTPTATGTSGASSIVVSSVTGIDVGEILTGTGIGTNAAVASTWTGSTTIPLTVVNSGTVSGTITFTSSAASIFSNIARVWALGRVDGYKIIASTTPYHLTTSANRQENDAYNALILAARSSYDYVMDVHAKLTDYEDNVTNDAAGALWAADAIHFTNSGYGVIAQQAANAFQITGGDQFGPVPQYFRTYGTGTQNYRFNLSALYSQTTGTNDIGMGEFAGGICATCTNSTFIGNSAGGQVLSGDGAFFMGPLTGQNITAVSQQIMIGKQAGSAATNASVNSVGVGAFALASDAGGNNTGVGNAACDLVAGGSNDACLGSNAEVGATNTGAAQIGAGTNSTNSSLQFQSFNFLNAAGKITYTLATTTTNCAAVGTSAAPSLVACAAAPAGAFSCAVTASAGTCVVSDTAVTANSDIIVQEGSYLGTRLGVTCNTTPSSVPTITVASIVAGTSFTINVPTITTNPACYTFTIAN